MLTAAHPDASAQDRYGQVEFATSCSADAAATFNEAVALLHHMMYDQSKALFQEVADADCVMAQWGIAMTQLHPLWAPPSNEELALGGAAVDRARDLGGPTEREAAYIEAIAAFFETEGSFPVRLQAWEEGQAELHEQYPDDVDAVAFHVLSQLATAPADDPAFARQAAAGSITEKLLEDHPRHPGLIHYTIHAYDNPVLAGRGVDVARGYDRIAPDVPHALHMPSHIFVRLGHWEDVISWNHRSADAALEHPVGERTSMHFPHAIDYLVYGYLQIGDDDAARSALSELHVRDPYHPVLGAAYGLAAPPARLALERRDWPEAATLPVREPASFPWSDFPAAESITWFARGLGSAMEGNEVAAQEAVDRLNELHDALVQADEAYWAVHTDAQRVAVGSWMQYAAGQTGDALEEMRSAADLEDSVDKHPVTPSTVLPMRELLGEMLLMMERPDEALQAFEAALKISPRRLNSLTGAARAAEMLEDRQTAAQYYGQVEEILGGRSDADRPRMADTRAFLIGDRQ